MATALETFRSLDSNLDWTWGAGRQNYATLENAINLDIATALKVFLGEIFWATNVGVDWWNLLGGKNETAIILQTRSTIISREGVQRITSLFPTLDRRTRNLNLTYAIDTKYSRALQGSVSIPTI